MSNESVDLFMDIVTTKKRRVDPTLVRKWVGRKSGKWIQKWWVDSFPHFFVLNTGSVQTRVCGSVPRRLYFPALQ
jgi:hypothetical protein